MTTASVTARGHGKLFIAGEYAVVEPGGGAIVVGLDRGVTVTARVTGMSDAIGTSGAAWDGASVAGGAASGSGVSGGAGHAAWSGGVRSAHYGAGAVAWRWQQGGATWLDAERKADHVLAAIDVVLSCASELRLPGACIELEIESALTDADGRKHGLGSSGAVTVAIVRAMSGALGLGFDELALCKASLLAVTSVEPLASGGDVAAACFGGWIAYRSPDRAALGEARAARGPLAVIREPWPGLRIERLPQPAGLRLLVGWTGDAASTPGLVGDVRAKSRDAAHSAAFLTESDAIVTSMERGLRAGDDGLVLAAIRSARPLLAGFGERLGVRIETPRLTRLCEIAERHGAAAKSSGAGGGDCGIALLPAAADPGELLRAWQREGIEPLPVSPVSVDGPRDAP